MRSPENQSWTEHLGLLLVKLRGDLRSKDKRKRDYAQLHYRRVNDELTQAIGYVQHIRKCHRQQNVVPDIV
jgi:hypothetical protein